MDFFAVNRNTASGHHDDDAVTATYCGVCARITISVGGDSFGAGPAFGQSLSLRDARCTVKGDAVRADCWIAAGDDVLVITVTDARETSWPIDVALSMWPEPEVLHGPHSAEFSCKRTERGVSILQIFHEADHYCSTAVTLENTGDDTPEVGMRVEETSAANGVRPWASAPLPTMRQ